MSSDPSSHILHAVHLLLQRAPAADAADDVVERWGGYVVQLLDGLNERQPEFLLLLEVISLINHLQNRVDARQRVAWLAWGGNWLPGTMIKQCLSRLPVAPAADNSASPPPPPTETSLPVVTAEKTGLELEESVEWDRPLDMGFGPFVPDDAVPDDASTSISTSSTKRTPALDEASSSQERPAKRSRLADCDTTIVKSEMIIVGLGDNQPQAIKDEENSEIPLPVPAPSYTDMGIQASSSDGDDAPYRVSCGIDFASLDLPDQLASGNVRAIKDAAISVFDLAQLIVGPSEEPPSVTPTLDLDLVVNFARQAMVTGWVHVSAATTQMRKSARSYEAVLHIRSRKDQ